MRTPLSLKIIAFRLVWKFCIADEIPLAQSGPCSIIVHTVHKQSQSLSSSPVCFLFKQSLELTHAQKYMGQRQDRRSTHESAGFGQQPGFFYPGNPSHRQPAERPFPVPPQTNGFAVPGAGGQEIIDDINFTKDPPAGQRRPSSASAKVIISLLQARAGLASEFI